MKNLLTIGAVVCVFALTSCSKERDCTCVTTDTTTNTVVSTTTTPLEGNKSSAETACDLLEVNVDPNLSVSCTLD